MGESDQSDTISAVERDTKPEPEAGENDRMLSRVGDVIVFSAPALALPAVLSDSEKSVARALIAGYSNADIARSRGTSTKTVANQLYAMYRKLGVGTREELVRVLVGS
jgi:DNA-binding CsgD family transcriptional regulator